MNTCLVLSKAKNKSLHTQNPQKSNFTIILIHQFKESSNYFHKSLFELCCLKSITEESTPLNILISSDFLSRQFHFSKSLSHNSSIPLYGQRACDQISVLDWDQSSAPRIFHLLRESACSVNRTNPSPLHSRYIFIYTQQEFQQEGGERKEIYSKA